MVVQEQYKSYGTTVAKFDKSVVRNQPRQCIFEMDTGILGKEKFEIAEASRVESNQQRNNFGESQSPAF